MRDFNLDIDNFLSQLAQLCESVPSRGNFLRDAVVDNPNFLDVYLTDLILPKRLDDCIVLAISSWYIKNQEVACLIRLDLEKKALNENFWILRFFLESRFHSELFLIETKLYHTRDFFGNLMTKNRLLRVYNRLRFRRRSTRVKRTQRKRGYHDKGTLKESHEWTPSHDWSLTEQQNVIESKRKALDDTHLSLVGFIT